ncbi:MAG: hypothetical protein JST00_41980 [Deltaproteobacteria bacterium]|nr:hypothetical protein [Deltaproteobacteria bacterium]
MRTWFFASVVVSSFAFGGAGCEWATEKTRTPREPTWGAELVVNVSGGGSVVSAGPGIACPGVCYARIVPDLAVDAAPRGITLRAIPAAGFRFVGWKADPARIAGHGPGPPECNPLRRRGQTPDLGAAGEVTLPFGEDDGFPPPGMSEKCAEYSRVPIAYNLTATFEKEASEASDVWAQLPAGFANDLTVSSTRVFVRHVSNEGLLRVLSLPLAAPTTIASYPASSSVTPAFDMTHHVVWQEPNTTVVVIDRERDVRTTFRPGVSCTALASSASFVFCRTFDRRLFRWTLDGNNLAILHSALPQGVPMTASATHVYLVVDDGATSSIQRLPIAIAGDAGAPSLEPITLGLASPSHLRADDRFVYAAVQGAVDGVARFPVGGGTPATFSLSANDLLYVPDPPAGEPLVWAATSESGSSWKIGSYRRTDTTQTGTIARELRRAVRGLAVDASYFYWTDDTDKIYRGRR